MKQKLIELVKQLLDIDLAESGKVVGVVMYLLIIALIAIITWSCSSQYVHTMSYQNGDERVTIECQTTGKVEKEK